MNFLLLKINNRYIIKKNFKEILQMKDTIDKLVDIDNQSRELIGALIYKIIIDKDRNIEIIYKFSMLNA